MIAARQWASVEPATTSRTTSRKSLPRMAVPVEDGKREVLAHPRREGVDHPFPPVPGSLVTGDRGLGSVGVDGNTRLVPQVVTLRPFHLEALQARDRLPRVFEHALQF